MKMNLALCCNDPDNGQHTGEVSRVELLDVIDLETPFVNDDWEPDGLLCSVDTRAHILELDGLKFNLKGYQFWTGNICWDTAILESVHVAKIVNHLKKRGWSCNEAVSELFDKYSRGEEITTEDLEKYYL